MTTTYENLQPPIPGDRVVLATGTTPGALSAAGFTKLASLPSGGWAEARWLEMLACEPTLTDAYPMLGINGGMVAPSVPADMTWTETVQGGFVTTTVDDAWHQFGPKWFDAGTAPFGFAWEGTMPAQNGAVYAGVGLFATDTNKLVILSSFGAHSMSNFELNWYEGGQQYIDTTVPLDTGKHSFNLIVSTTNSKVYVYVDGFQVIAVASAGKWTNATFQPVYYGDAAGLTFSKVMVGYKRP